jgi:putative colanic acid biosynthesis acetyltransferase WcaF
MKTDPYKISESLENFDAKPLVDLRQYNQSNFDRGRPSWLIILWWLIQAIAFPLSLHNFNFFRCWLLRLFGK